MSSETYETPVRARARENAETKANRYLLDGRVIVTDAGRDLVNATVRGDGEVHHVSYRRGGWSCTCPARGRCAHLLAVGLVTAPRRGTP